jgi:DNA primase
MLDGDTAGQRAAMRVIDLSLPMLEAGQSVRFAVLPTGLDPDDLIRSKGAAAIRAVVDAAQPMVRLLWQREIEGKDFDSPERKAALDKGLREKIALIRDPSVRGHYGEAIKELRWELFGARRKPAGTRRSGGGTWSGSGRMQGGKWMPPPAPAMPSTKVSVLAAALEDDDSLREAVILAMILKTPSVAAEFLSELERMECRTPGFTQLRRAILRHLGAPDLWDLVASEVGAETLEKLLAQTHVAISPGVRRAGDLDVVRMCLAEELAKLNARRGHARELAEAEEDLATLADEGLTWRLSQAAQAVDRAGRGDNDDKAEYVVGPNGARMKKDERSAFDQLLGKIDYAKGHSGPTRD